MKKQVNEIPDSLIDVIQKKDQVGSLRFCRFSEAFV